MQGKIILYQRDRTMIYGSQCHVQIQRLSKDRKFYEHKLVQDEYLKKLGITENME